MSPSAAIAVDTATIQRAYSVLHVKSIDVEGRTISGVASTPTPDRMGDIVVPLGMKFKNPSPLLLFHDTTRPVGTVKFDKPTEDGLTFTAKLVDPAEVTSESLRERVTEAWESIKLKLIRGVSIGFRPLDDGIELNPKTGGLVFTKTEILELSLVTIPANSEATILSIKQFDQAGSGRSTTTPVVSGSVRVSLKGTRGDPKMTTNAKSIAERLVSFREEKSAKVQRMNALMGTDDGSTFDAEQQAEYDTLKTEVKALTDHIARMEELEELNKSVAAPVAGSDPVAAAKARGGDPNPRITVRDTLPKGMGFARSVKAAVVARLDGRDVLAVAKQMYPSDERLHAHLAHMQNIPNIIMQLKAAVPAATMNNTTWAGALSDPTNLAEEFIEFLRPATIVGRLNLRNIPTNVRLIEQTQGGTGYWVGQGAAKPLTAFGYAPVTLGPTKVAAIAVATEEQLRFSTPSLDMLIRDGLRDALVERVDRDLLDPAEAGTANVQPASLTNGVTPLSSAGTSSDNIRTDISKLVQALRTANLRGPIAVVLPDSLLTAMAWMVNSLGQPEFPGLNGDGGTFNGIKFIGSEYVANASGSGNMVVAIAEREVFMSDDGGVRVDASREASLQMLDNPTNNSATATATTMVSMWQTNSVAYRGEWFVNWQKRRSDAVAFIDDVNWGSVGSPE
jgi:HK97 family phage major capsid protein/HK97 family phage prohead protease